MRRLGVPQLDLVVIRRHPKALKLFRGARSRGDRLLLLSNFLCPMSAFLSPLRHRPYPPTARAGGNQRPRGSTLSATA